MSMLQSACRLHFFLDFKNNSKDQNDVNVPVCLQTVIYVCHNDVYVTVCLQTAIYECKNDK